MSFEQEAKDNRIKKQQTRHGKCKCQKKKTFTIEFQVTECAHSKLRIGGRKNYMEMK